MRKFLFALPIVLVVYLICSSSDQPERPDVTDLRREHEELVEYVQTHEKLPQEMVDLWTKHSAAVRQAIESGAKVEDIIGDR